MAGRGGSGGATRRQTMEHDDDRSGRHVPPLFLRNNNQLTMTIVEEATCDGDNVRR